MPRPDVDMRRLLTRNGFGLILLLAASASCGGSSPPAPAAPTGPTPLPAPIVMSTRCSGPFHPGETAPGACFLDVAGASPPVRAFADLRQFGGRAEAELVQCPACGAPPWQFDLDVRIPADMPPGPRTVPVWAMDAHGRRADTTAVFQVTAR